VEVHARDVIDKLGKAGASSPTDFEWVSQLRFYWDRATDNCVVKQVRRQGPGTGSAVGGWPAPGPSRDRRVRSSSASPLCCSLVH